MDDLEWLDGLPDEWKVPVELGEPTRNPFNNFVIQVLSSPYVSNGVSLVIGELLAEKERFTTWYMTEAKGSVDDRRLLELYIESSHVFGSCWSAWLEFTEGTPQHSTFRDRYITLLEAWAKARNAYRSLRGQAQGVDE